KKISKPEKDKIALFCNVEEAAVIQALDVPSIYEVPSMFSAQGIEDIIIKKLGIRAKQKKTDLSKWDRIVRKLKNPKKTVRISVVGKYVEVADAYKSIKEALLHGGIANDVKLDLNWVDSETLTANGAAEKALAGSKGVLVPGGFGNRGIEGKIKAIRYAREKKIPFLGICLGMQLSVVEFARNVAHLKNANSTEFDKDTCHPVISLLEEQKNVKDMGATMRLGAFPCKILEGTKAAAAYREKFVFERHRHRYEFNGGYREELEKKGLVISGVSPSGDLVEIIEIAGHPWFVASQFHPEFKSKPSAAHPLFRDFVAAAAGKARK
ncbi:MAG TPA: CTP synthase, partial [Candidatus Goldiibacteriota bacterium]|nr:CTP synthase [Candidatus Goldiibacteriota bacterium]